MGLGFLGTQGSETNDRCFDFTVYSWGPADSVCVCECVDGRFRVLVCRQMFVGMEDLLFVVI